MSLVKYLKPRTIKSFGALLNEEFLEQDHRKFPWSGEAVISKEHDQTIRELTANFKEFITEKTKQLLKKGKLTADDKKVINTRVSNYEKYLRTGEGEVVVKVGKPRLTNQGLDAYKLSDVIMLNPPNLEDMRNATVRNILRAQPTQITSYMIMQDAFYKLGLIDEEKLVGVSTRKPYRARKSDAILRDVAAVAFSIAKDANINTLGDLTGLFVPLSVSDDARATIKGAIPDSATLSTLLITPDVARRKGLLTDTSIQAPVQWSDLSENYIMNVIRDWSVTSLLHDSGLPKEDWGYCYAPDGVKKTIPREISGKVNANTERLKAVFGEVIRATKLGGANEYHGRYQKIASDIATEWVPMASKHFASVADFISGITVMNKYKEDIRSIVSVMNPSRANTDSMMELLNTFRLIFKDIISSNNIVPLTLGSAIEQIEDLATEREELKAELENKKANNTETDIQKIKNNVIASFKSIELDMKADGYLEGMTWKNFQDYLLVSKSLPALTARRNLKKKFNVSIKQLENCRNYRDFYNLLYNNAVSDQDEKDYTEGFDYELAKFMANATKDKLVEYVKKGNRSILTNDHLYDAVVAKLLNIINRFDDFMYRAGSGDRENYLDTLFNQIADFREEGSNLRLDINLYENIARDRRGNVRRGDEQAWFLLKELDYKTIIDYAGQLAKTPAGAAIDPKIRKFLLQQKNEHLDPETDAKITSYLRSNPTIYRWKNSVTDIDVGDGLDDYIDDSEAELDDSKIDAEFTSTSTSKAGDGGVRNPFSMNLAIQLKLGIERFSNQRRNYLEYRKYRYNRNYINLIRAKEMLLQIVTAKCFLDNEFAFDDYAAELVKYSRAAQDSAKSSKQRAAFNATFNKDLETYSKINTNLTDKLEEKGFHLPEIAKYNATNTNNNALYAQVANMYKTLLHTAGSFYDIDVQLGRIRLVEQLEHKAEFVKAWVKAAPKSLDFEVNLVGVKKRATSKEEIAFNKAVTAIFAQSTKDLSMVMVSDDPENEGKFKSITPGVPEIKDDLISTPVSCYIGEKSPLVKMNIRQVKNAVAKVRASLARHIHANITNVLRTNKDIAKYFTDIKTTIKITYCNTPEYGIGVGKMAEAEYNAPDVRDYGDNFLAYLSLAGGHKDMHGTEHSSVEAPEMQKEVDEKHPFELTKLPQYQSLNECLKTINQTIHDLTKKYKSFYYKTKEETQKAKKEINELKNKRKEIIKESGFESIYEMIGSPKNLAKYQKFRKWLRKYKISGVFNEAVIVRLIEQYRHLFVDLPKTTQMSSLLKLIEQHAKDYLEDLKAKEESIPTPNPPESEDSYKPSISQEEYDEYFSGMVQDPEERSRFQNME